ncbi:TIGR03086 family metal-binding protein [Streptomyces albipurpureus]|uniref:TIGR03086 family metal-binding protein n=1 Tax=Streptomyces albipurpureus TaxID=2897419 RepID=A0ABT0V189_9ACTN|nr:TIGR03086 family metal-binding protein [Streptomyces sp. CWNU-1]MCM2393655.1 TIGR03086 family metal-binding protein [Streptomyces sp. CWNU-1]
MNDPRPLYDQAAAQFSTLLKVVTPARLSDPTPCAKFDVRGLLAHSVNGLNMWAMIGDGEDWTKAPPREGTIADHAWAAAYDDAHHRFTRAWSDDAKLGRMFSAPWAEQLPGGAMVAFVLLENVVHAWDLSQALGWSPPLESALAEAVLPMAREQIPAFPRGGEMPFGEVREAPTGADVYGQLAAWLGREVPHSPSH